MDADDWLNFGRSLFSMDTVHYMFGGNYAADMGNFALGEAKDFGNFATGTVSLGFWQPFSSDGSQMQNAGLGTGNVLSLVGSLFAPFATAGSATTVAVAGEHCVYESVNLVGQTQYVGITNNIARRTAQHASRFKIAPIRGLSNLTREQARAAEQVLIELHGLGKNGGTLVNKINSIATTNPAYAKAVKTGRDLLHNAGYAGF